MTPSRFERELALESEMVEFGANRTWANVLKARKADHESRTVYGQRLISAAVEQFSIAVREFIKVIGPGRRHSTIPTLQQLDHKVLAFITLQSVINSLTTKKNHTRAAVLLGRRVEDELRFKLFNEKNAAFWTTLVRDLGKREHNLKRRRGILIHEMKKAAQLQRELEWNNWTDTARFHVGAKCIELLEASTGLVRKAIVGHGRKKFAALEATPDTMAFVKELSGERCGVCEPCKEAKGEACVNWRMLDPMLLPTIIPPKRWKNPFVGGYHLTTLRTIPLVKVYGERGNNYLEEIANNVEKMPMVYEAINAVQSTPWKVNASVLTVLHQAWKAGLEVGDMPSTQEIPLPPKPADIATNQEARRAWSRKASAIYSENARRNSRVIQMTKLLWLADKFLGEEAIYFPMQLDFRGRMYALPSFLNPQGNDPAKGLLTFARGKKLGASGLRWLHIHAANMWGEDKVSLDARVEWTKDNYHLIQRSAVDPLGHRWWMQADKPWQFLAAAFEIVAACERGKPEEFFSHLPISVDGTCNGLQHFSAMLLDEVGADAVNLKPAPLPNDIYQRVADVVKARLQREAAQGDQLAKEWLAWGFDRKATKRAVMIVPYSGTLFAAKEYTLDYIQDREGCPWEDKWMPAMYFARHVWAAIAQTVSSAKEVMKWLRSIAGIVAVHGTPVVWTTPVGFPVVQDYREMESFLVETALGDKCVYRPRLERETVKLDKRAQEQGVSPNFVHSLDAACLMLTVVRGREDGIQDFAMVHDSYGVLAADMETLYVGLRQAFVDIYMTDVLSNFLSSATGSLSQEELKKIPLMPVKGKFQLESVKESKYFFA